MQGFSADGRVQAEATLQAALDQGLPVQPLYVVMLEGQAKGAGETRILGAEQQTLARLGLAQQAIVSAGRPQPSDAEVTRGASLIAQGMTSAELGAVVGQVPPQQSLMVALDGLGAGMAAVVGTGADATAGIGSGASTAASASTAVSADLGAGGPVARCRPPAALRPRCREAW